MQNYAKHKIKHFLVKRLVDIINQMYKRTMQKKHTMHNIVYVYSALVLLFSIKKSPNYRYLYIYFYKSYYVLIVTEQEVVNFLYIHNNIILVYKCVNPEISTGGTKKINNFSYLSILD